MGYKKKAKALRVLPSGKASKGVFYSSVGSGGYCRVSILGIPSARKLTATNVNSLGWSKMYLRSCPTPRARAPSRQTPWARAPSRQNPQARVPSRPTRIHTTPNHYGSKSMTLGSNF